MSTDTKKCPYCAEEINVDAVKCKHCGEAVGGPQQGGPPPPGGKGLGGGDFRRSRNDRILFGVCGGLAKQFNVDANIIRIAVVLITAFSAGLPGVIVYIILGIVLPEGD